MLFWKRTSIPSAKPMVWLSMLVPMSSLSWESMWKKWILIKRLQLSINRQSNFLNSIHFIQMILIII